MKKPATTTCLLAALAFLFLPACGNEFHSGSSASYQMEMDGPVPLVIDTATGQVWRVQGGEWTSMGRPPVSD